ncbi:CAP domain-containing protein [Primorskyibacter sp. S187A]|uniref:CAP domain-containing protein n=1 Tax=Primorskyibacter sp. S187A TaxID=3415130 RepID=UPI003C7C7AAA
MLRFLTLMIILVTGLSACAPQAPAPTLGPDGLPLPKLYRIAPGSEGRIQFRVLDSVNSLRQAAGVASVSLNAQLNAAAATHARDMSVQNRPWHFGSDGSSPIDRVRRVGYSGRLIGEAISETYETEVQTLAAWMDEEGTHRIIMSPDATQMGFAFFQEQNGKIWWTLIMGGPNSLPAPTPLLGAESAVGETGVNEIATTAIELSADG